MIDHRTGAPVRGVVGATVRGPTCAHADALTKVVMASVEAAGRLLEFCGASALFVSGRGIHVTADWQDAVRLAA